MALRTAFEDEFRFHRTDIWREGQWLDLWSVVHLFSGMATGFAAVYLRLEMLFALVLSIVLFTVYEGWEVSMDIEETPPNRFMDVVVGTAGYLAAYFLLMPLLPQHDALFAFAISFGLASGLSVFGWRASVKANALKKRLHERYVARMERRRRRRARMNQGLAK